MPAKDPLARCGAVVDQFISKSLEKWGRIVYNHTWKVFLGCIFLALVMIAGVSRLKSETETENLWTPRGALVKDDKAVYDKMFGTGFRIESIYFSSKTEGGNVLTRDAFMEMYDFDTKYRRDMRVTVENVAYNFSSLCAKARPTDAFCLAGGSPLEFVYNIETHRFDFSLINDDAALLAAINRASIDFTPDGSKETYSLDISNRQDLFAGTQRDANGKITKATYLQMTWFASRQNDTVRAETCTGSDSEGKKMTRISCNPTVVWEDEFERLVVEKFNKESKHIKAYVQTATSISNELGKVIGGDVVSLNIGLFLIVLYAILVLGKFHPVLSRSALAWGGVVSVGLAVGGAFGLGGWTGIPQTPVTSVLPFILLGIGVDDMFVLAGALGRAPKHWSPEDRIAYMMKHAGSSIFITTLTDTLAFALSCTTAFPALQYFCIWAVYGIVLDFTFQITFFVCCCVWDEQRIAIRGRDCYCCGGVCCAKNDGCCSNCIVPEEVMEQTGCQTPFCCLTCQKKEGGYLRDFMRDSYAPILTKLPVKIAVLLVFTGIFAFGCWGSTQLTENFSLRFFVPSDSPLNTVFDIQDKEYRTGATSISIMLDHQKDGVYLHQAKARADSPRIATAVEGFAYFEKGTLVDPLLNFTTYLFETADNFPMSPHFFWTAEKDGSGFNWLGRQETFGSSNTTIYPDTLASDLGAGPALIQGGISAGTWPLLRTNTYMEGIPADGSMSRSAYIKDTKLFYDVLAHYLTTPQGAGLRSYFAPYQWYEGFTDWIENLPDDKVYTDGAFTLDKRRMLSKGMLSDVHNGTARPKHPAKFCEALKYFLNTNATLKAMVQPPLDESDPNCYPKSGDYAMTRVGADMKCRVDSGPCPLSNATAEVEIMQGSRKIMTDLKSDLNPKAYSFQWLFSEQYAVVRAEALSSIVQAIIAVAVVTIIFISHAWTGLLVCVTVVMVLFDIVGLMWLWDVSINSISIVNLVLAIGLAVDYSAHVGHAFMKATGTNDERVVKALGEMGADVMHGVLSTFLAVVVMASSKSYIFVLFFRQFFGICLFGAFHGLMFLPVILSLVGPPSSADENDIKAHDAEHASPYATTAASAVDVVVNKTPEVHEPAVANSQFDSDKAFPAPSLAVGERIGQEADEGANGPVDSAAPKEV